MSRIGIIVDGLGDYASVQKKFKGKVKVLKTDGPRGHCAPISEIVAKSRKQVRMLNDFNCKKIIILLDYECRLLSYNKFVKDLRECSKNTFGNKIKICSPNRMIENWYLADIEILSKKKAYIRKNLKQKKYEGVDGKEYLKRLYERKYSYSETEHGPELFCIIRDTVATKNSYSYKDF